MPHIVIQMNPGRDERAKQEIAEHARTAISQKMNAPANLFSEGIEEIAPENWKAQICGNSTRLGACRGTIVCRKMWRVEVFEEQKIRQY